MRLTSVHIVLIVITIIVVLLLLGCFWDCLPFSGSSKCLFKKKCGKEKGYCKRCGTMPCCCSKAEICGISRTLIDTTAGEDDAGDQYLFTIEGAGLTAGSINMMTLNIVDPGTGLPYTALANVTTYTYTSTDLNGLRLTYATSGYSMSFIYTTNGVGEAGPSPPRGPAASGNAGIPSWTLSGTTLVVNLPLELA